MAEYKLPKEGSREAGQGERRSSTPAPPDDPLL